MKPISAFFAATLVALVVSPPHAEGPRFVEGPTVRRFSDGAIEWSASISCANPADLLGAKVVFSLDKNLDGMGDTAVVTGLSPADCEDDRLPLHRAFFFSTPAVLRAEVQARAGGSGNSDSVTDVRSILSGEVGSLLLLRTFCARPKNGEPEWIEIRNISDVTVSLEKVKVEARLLAGSMVAPAMDPGESVTVLAASDTAEMRLWRPGARAIPLASWPALRNSGDTLRVSVDVKARDGSTAALVLDSVIYGAGASTREACASVPTEESGAGAHGFGIEVPPGRWMRRAGPLSINVTAPQGSPYDVRVYDLDGLELCSLARRAVGPQVLSLSSATCGRLSPGVTAVLIQLAPRRAPSVRRLLWITP
jgi:hypothetical protein